MYTLEDDQETSAGLRKRDFLGASSTSPLFADPGSGGTNAEGHLAGTIAGQFIEAGDSLDDSSQPTAKFPRLFSPRQIPSSFKQITRPVKNAGGPRGKRADLAAML